MATNELLFNIYVSFNIFPKPNIEQVLDNILFCS